MAAVVAAETPKKMVRASAAQPVLRSPLKNGKTSGVAGSGRARSNSFKSDSGEICRVEVSQLMARPTSFNAPPKREWEASTR
jgi:hypothetical protein